MIDGTAPAFPNNAVDLIYTRSQTIDTDLGLFRRPLRPSDPVQSVGIFGTLWVPDNDSLEFRGSGFGTPGPQEPTISRYTMSAQALVQDMDEERGLYTHSVLSALLRSMLYRDAPLRVGLAALNVTMSGVTERATRWGIGQTRYLSNEISGTWLYLSTLDFWLETETGI